MARPSYGDAAASARFAAIAISTLLTACSSSSPPPPSTAPPAIRLLRIVAHRGASIEAPENTLAAFRRAWELGAEAVELDVRITSDGAVVVIHDDTTRRVAGVDRPVADQTLAELRALDVGGWKAARYAGERIPTLAEALATVPAGGTLFVEIKTGPATAPAVARAILDANPAARGGAVALQAFDPDALAALAAGLPGVPAYWTVDPPMDAADRPLPYPREVIDAAVDRKFAGLALDVRGVTDDFLAAARGAGLSIDVWTLNDRDGIRAWLARDVRWIETDQPELAAAP